MADQSGARAESEKVCVMTEAVCESWLAVCSLVRVWGVARRVRARLDLGSSQARPDCGHLHHVCARHRSRWRKICDG